MPGRFRPIHEVLVGALLNRRPPKAVINYIKNRTIHWLSRHAAGRFRQIHGVLVGILINRRINKKIWSSYIKNYMGRTDHAESLIYKLTVKRKMENEKNCIFIKNDQTLRDFLNGRHSVKFWLRISSGRNTVFSISHASNKRLHQSKTRSNTPFRKFCTKTPI